MKRVLSALVALPLVLIPLALGDVIFSLLVWMLCTIAAYEWTRLLYTHSVKQGARQNAGRDTIILSGLTAIVLAAGHVLAMEAAFLLLLAIILIGAGALYMGRKRLTPIIGGLLYIVWAALVLVAYRNGAHGFFIALYILVIVWAVDICALIVGKLIGGPRLVPTLSPNKTWAGLVGAMLGASLVNGGLIYLGFAPSERIFVLGIMMALIAQAGDIFESAIKRKYNVKDSGAFMPGHGGLLDRIDGLLMVLIFMHLMHILTENRIW